MATPTQIGQKASPPQLPGKGGTTPTKTQPVSIQPVTSQPVTQPVTVQPAAPATPSAVQAAQQWLANLVAAYNALVTYLQTVSGNLSTETSSWGSDSANLSGVVTTLQGEQPSASWVTNDLIDTVKQGQSDILTAELLVGQATQGIGMVLDPHSGLGGLDIAATAPQVSALLAQLAQAAKAPVAASGGGVKTSTAVATTVGGVAVGGMLGGLLGHAIGSGALFAGESKRRDRAHEEEETLAAESKKRPKKKTRRKS